MHFKEGKAIYLQIAEHLMGEIVQGIYPEDERMPSVREYAGKVEVNVNTLVRTYDWLQQQDIIYTKRGLGYFVCAGACERIRMVQREQFFCDTLPEVFRQMQTFGITTEELIERLGEMGKEN